MMLTVKDYLMASGLDVEAERIKLVKHVDYGKTSIRVLMEMGVFDDFQALQSSATNPFHKCDVIISFLGSGDNLAGLVGVYWVRGCRDLTLKDVKQTHPMLEVNSVRNDKGIKRIRYDLVKDSRFCDLENRLIVQWKSTRGWFQKKDLDIYELLPAVKVIPFPGYQDVLLSYKDLKQIINNPRAHKDWKAALEANAGIYRIVDMSSGEIYIGSAYGREGLWGRWCNYARNGHGGNKLLKGREPDCFLWSIVRTVSRSMSERDVIKVEAREKQKYGSRVHGLNDN